jgi:hypothetical protein
MSHKSGPPTVSTIGIDLGKNSFHLIGLDQRGRSFGNSNARALNLSAGSSTFRAA